MRLEICNSNVKTGGFTAVRERFASPWSPSGHGRARPSCPTGTGTRSRRTGARPAARVRYIAQVAAMQPIQSNSDYFSTIMSREMSFSEYVFPCPDCTRMSSGSYIFSDFKVPIFTSHRIPDHRSLLTSIPRAAGLKEEKVGARACLSAGGGAALPAAKRRSVPGTLPCAMSTTCACFGRLSFRHATVQR